MTDLDDELTLNKSLNDTEEQYSYCKERVDAAAADVQRMMKLTSSGTV